MGVTHLSSLPPETPHNPSPPTRRPSFRLSVSRVKTFSSLQNYVNYRYLWTGNLFANCAQWLQFITIGWLALDISGSALHSILAVAIRALPVLLIGPWAGVLADRLDRRKLVIAAQFVMVLLAVAFGALLANGKVDSIWHVYGYMLVSGIAFAFVAIVGFGVLDY